MIKSGDFVVLGAAASAPNATLNALHTIAPRVEEAICCERGIRNRP